MVFYRDVLGLGLLDDSMMGRGAAFQVGSSVLLLFRAEVTRQPTEIPQHGASGAGHAAFLVDADEIPAWRERLAEHNVVIEKEIRFGDNPPSIYFRDPDGNSLELSVASIWRLHGDSHPVS